MSTPPRRIFISATFEASETDLLEALINVVQSHDYEPVTGKDLGGESVANEIERRISQCHGLIAMATSRHSVGETRFVTHPWVRDELAFAVANKLPVLAIVETNVDLGGALDVRERVAFDRKNPLPTFLKVGRTLALWRARDLGRSRRIWGVAGVSVSLALGVVLGFAIGFVVASGGPASDAVRKARRDYQVCAEHSGAFACKDFSDRIYELGAGRESKK